MMSKTVLFVVGWLGLASFGSAQFLQLGQCETINLMDNFVLNSFAGTGMWYEVGKSSNQIGDCSRLDFVSGSGIIIVTDRSVVNNFAQVAAGLAVHTSGTSRLTLTMTSSNNPIDFWILNTDYISWAIAINCVNMGNLQRIVNVWQLGRAANAFETPATLTAANNALSAIGIKTSELTSVDHSTNACTELPVIGAGQPVILPGQCSTTVPVIQNFNVESFVGTWYGISSYYSEIAVGTCARAHYSLVGTTVNVVNSQVLNSRLDTITGTATLVGTDGAGRLNVVLNVNGVPVTQELLILDTNYDGYAVSYTCVNLANNQRRVNSWILSRTQSMSEESEQEVNRVINSLLDLNTAYYQTTDQSAAGCFYLPEAEVGRPVIFPGQCDETVAAVPGFNLGQFVGTWHEVQTYPKEQQTGSCVNHDFTTDTTANTLNVVSNQVFNQIVYSASGNVAFESADGSGKLRLSMTVDGLAINFPYWILATDYTSYALVYSCMNGADNTRAVYSWKLSRTQTLPEAANIPINTAIAAVQVLDDQYYEFVDQSAAGCLAYPEIPPGEPIILQGRCETVTPMTNFQFIQFAGTWYEAARYPSARQRGDCAASQFVTSNHDSYALTQTIIYNERLTVVSGAALVATDGSGVLTAFLTDEAGLEYITNIYVMDTDYVDFALLYSCDNIPGTDNRQIYSWKFSRTQAGLSQVANDRIAQVIANNIDLFENYYQTTDQSAASCFYLPEAEVGKPVVFPGQCDETVAAVPAFNLGQFVGTWHEVQTYPMEQQTGSCVNHAFTTGTTANTLNLVSNQVVNQIATSASGNVAFESTDGSGRLRLSMTVDGVDISFPYWILATDYTSYALVYSCINRADNTRAVYSWKLSRTQTLPAAANTPINTAIAAVQVLDNQYYEAVDQSAAGCLAYPEIPPGEPIILQGQCGTVTRLTNFQFDQFSGTWYEVARYPSARQNGDCAASLFETRGMYAYTLTQTIIYNERLTVRSGQAYITIDGIGVFIAMLTDEAGLVDIRDIYVMDTDYVDFALLYSCDNIPGTDNRQIYSWKFSRTQAGLSQMANDRIAQVVADNIDLFENYYQTTDQSDASCFYLPDAEVGRPVIFPGQCDETVAAVPAFNLGQFVGIWHEVQTYPKEQQTGSCVNHAFTTGTTANTLNLVSNQVINQIATSASGNVAFESTDGSGRLRLSMTVNGLDINFPYWILATDYTSYALIYSCMNRADNTRAVYSWKLSRTQTLPDATNAPINTAIAAVQVLDNQYYEAVDQSAAGCLVYPEIPPGEPIILPGQCGTVTPVTNFQFYQFRGTWYEAARYPSARQSGDCASSLFETSSMDGYTLTQTIVYNERLTVVSGLAFIAIDGTGVLTATLSDGADLTYTTTIYILDTDYVDYALLYSCDDIPGTNNRQIYSWKFSRTQAGLSQVASDRIAQVVADNIDLFENYFQTTDQSAASCFYLPDAEVGRPVTFPGQCDETVAAVPAFNLGQFVGIWHEVQTYPKEQQTGSCVNHAFTIGITTDTLNLVSNQVINQIVTSASGNVAFESTDGSGRLRLSMTVDGSAISIPYWILATDYTSYALIYSCVNRADNTRAVYSWKLSRTQTLPDAANAPINTAIAAVQVLDNQYYEAVDQSAAGCLANPPGESIIFPGQCGTVAPVTNFQFYQFRGTWYEAARYPSARQSGDCASSLFETSSMDGYTLTQTIVYNERLTVVSGIAFIAIDGTGVLTATLSDGADLIYTTTIYILDTDYVDYALLYSCDDIPGTNNRQIYSWKFSRTQAGLSQVASDRIAQVVANNIDLFENYFQTTDQSAASCFYLPDAEVGRPVIFPGQCDETVAAVPAFNLGQFVGIWHEVQTYPKEQQTGSCVNHDFTTGTTANTLNLVSNQVVNQIATSASGNVAFESTDGSGRLRLSMTVNGLAINFPYWILATDYTSYALIYSCINRADDTRAVYSWKLSRTQTLPAAANIPINTAIAAVQVLDNQYYEAVDQSAAGCVTYPDFPPGEPIILQGRCGIVTPMSNFQFIQFAGTWYEAARYPSARQRGDCAASQFVTSNHDSYALTQTIIYNERLTVVSGAALVATDGSGVLTAFLTDEAGLSYITNIYVMDTDYVDFALLYSCDDIPGTNNRQKPTTTALRVLLTDYDNYALMYTCVNINAFQRSVGAFKVSRARTLSNDDLHAIENYMNTREELHQPYFISVSHNDQCPEPSSALLVKSSIIVMLVCVVLQLVM